ncbi:MAG: hypothetical protein ABI720_03825 [Actinomycetes bacterium]
MSDTTPQDPYAVPPAGGFPPPQPPQAAAPQPAYPPPPPAGYPAPTYPAAGYPGGQAPKPGPGAFAIIALVASILALLISWIPFVGAIAALVTLGLGIGAWVAAKKSGRPLGLGVAATIVSVLALIVGIVFTAGFLFLIDEVQKAEQYCRSVTATDGAFDRCMNDRVSNWFGVDTTP